MLFCSMGSAIAPPRRVFFSTGGFTAFGTCVSSDRRVESSGFGSNSPLASNSMPESFSLFFGRGGLRVGDGAS